MIVLRMTRSWYGKEDPGLTRRLLAELPGILLWAIEGWRRLRERGYFVQPGSSLPLIEEMEELTDQTGAFVRECCVVGPEHQVARMRLYEAWSAWCERNGRTLFELPLSDSRAPRSVLTGGIA
jgi:putative DNA primase/helicase